VPTETIEAPLETIESPFTLDLPGLDEIEDIRANADIQGPWIVILYNCSCHTFDEVEYILQKATGCSLEKAEAIAMEVHTKGRAICFSGEKEPCERVTAIIASIRLQVEMDRA
jgi:ATP-dependent Clp protease adaptor protein ClpS